MNNKKKIGIVTYWNTEENYGQVLQLFALQYQLKKMNHCPFLIRVIQGSLPTYIENLYSVQNITFRRIIDAIKRRLTKKQKCDVVKRGFQMFKDNYLTVSDRTYTPSELYITAPEADVYVCGSDQIWNYPNPVYLLDWCPKDKKRVAYAASFGRCEIPDYQKKSYSKLLNNLDLISVRENSGVDICKNIIQDKPCIQCLDPTLLLSKENYLAAVNIKDPVSDKKYIFLYLLGNKSKIDFDAIDDFAKEKGCDIIFVPSQDCILTRYNPTYPSIEEWLGLVKNAEYIITNSFHGTVFSIIFQREFLVLPLVGGDVRMNERLNSLFGTLEIKDRFVVGNTFNNKPIDYEMVNRNLEKQKKCSLHFIEKINAIH